MNHNRATLKKLQGKMISLLAYHEASTIVYDGEKCSGIIAYLSSEYGKLTNEQQTFLCNPFVLVLKVKKSSMQVLAANGVIYWIHPS